MLVKHFPSTDNYRACVFKILEIRHKAEPTSQPVKRQSSISSMVARAPSFSGYEVKPPSRPLTPPPPLEEIDPPQTTATSTDLAKAMGQMTLENLQRQATAPGRVARGRIPGNSLLRRQAPASSDALSSSPLTINTETIEYYQHLFGFVTALQVHYSDAFLNACVDDTEATPHIIDGQLIQETEAIAREKEFLFALTRARMAAADSMSTALGSLETIAKAGHPAASYYLGLLTLEQLQYAANSNPGIASLSRFTRRSGALKDLNAQQAFDDFNQAIDKNVPGAKATLIRFLKFYPQYQSIEAFNAHKLSDKDVANAVACQSPDYFVAKLVYPEIDHSRDNALSRLCSTNQDIRGLLLMAQITANKLKSPPKILPLTKEEYINAIDYIIYIYLMISAQFTIPIINAGKYQWRKVMDVCINNMKLFVDKNPYKKNEEVSMRFIAFDYFIKPIKQFILSGLEPNLKQMKPHKDVITMYYNVLHSLNLSLPAEANQVINALKGDGSSGC